MLTERKIFGKIEILPDGQIQLREDTIVERDGVVLTSLYHRRVLEPDMDVTGETDRRLQSIIAAIWTPEVINEYRRVKAERNARSNIPEIPVPVTPVR